MELRSADGRLTDANNAITIMHALERFMLGAVGLEKDEDYEDCSD